MDNKQKVLDAIEDSVSNFLYYDRKECENLPLDEIQRLIEEKQITIEEIEIAFQKALRNSLLK